MVIPFEWTDRPSARPVRDYIKGQKWGVDVYRLCFSVFPNVVTTAS
ncbi:MAG: eco57I restriction-modification methylase family protein, partial [Myxococcales bacterium]|nr:eco57I restriction-modification methylase family protein [Myxococcales bacterium]